MNAPNPGLAPFSCTYSPQVPELLSKLGISLAITTYQAGKIVFLSPKDEEFLVQLPRTLEKPMGIALKDNGRRMAIACLRDVITFTDSPELAQSYPKAPKRYDALYMPRTSYHVGGLDLHDLEWSDQGLFAVNTLFSSLIQIDGEYNYSTYWKPPFISELASEDRCHLNGMAMENGLPKYASMFNQGNTPQSWRPEVTTAGTIMDVTTDEILVEGLPMPHSPRMVNGELYVLLSATGGLARIDRAAGTFEEIVNLKGFVRGMAIHGEFAFVGLSKLRQNSSTFKHLQIAQESNQSGIKIVHLPTAAVVGEILYQTSVDEIYDVQVIPGRRRPNLLNTLKDDHYLGLMTPEATYWGRNTQAAQ
ncbi:TIGR03032 family protein [Cryomorphaceae bacterium]|nr:TIGR03032 family protein [Cryomorphaceae bacterium]